MDQLDADIVGGGDIAKQAARREHPRLDRELRALGAARLAGFLDSAIGKCDQLLVEAGNRGHGRNFAKIRLDGDFIPSGQLVDVELIGRDGDSLVGRAVAKGAQSA